MFAFIACLNWLYIGPATLIPGTASIKNIEIILNRILIFFFIGVCFTFKWVLKSKFSIALFSHKFNTCFGLIRNTLNKQSLMK